VKTASASASVAAGGSETGSGVIASATGSARASRRADAKPRASVPRRARRSPSEIIPTSRPSRATTGTWRNPPAAISLAASDSGAPSSTVAGPRVITADSGKRQSSSPASVMGHLRRDRARMARRVERP
jgi:hypothetical protein